MHPHAMNGSRPVAQALLACLGEESRFRLVQALMGGARCVTDLAAEVGLSQSCTTRHLQTLERRRLVSGRRDGKRVYYRIREDDPGLLALLGWALSEPKGAAGVRALRLSRTGAGSAARSSPDPALPGPDGSAAPPSPPVRELARSGQGQRPHREISPPGGPEPAAEARPEPGASATARPVRRASGSDLEDYLL